MDAKAGYWFINLDDDSQEITTFRTPFARYCYTRLLFGLYVSRDLFQSAIDRILDRTPGYVGIVVDVAVYGRNADENLRRLLQVAREEVVNSKKCVIKADKTVFCSTQFMVKRMPYLTLTKSRTFT